MSRKLKPKGVHMFRLTSRALTLLAIALSLLVYIAISHHDTLRECFGDFFYPLLHSEPPPEARTYEDVRRGMSRVEVRDLLGEPTKVGAAAAAYEEYGLGIEDLLDRPTWLAPAGGVFAYANDDRTAGCYIFFDEAGQVKQVRIFVKD